MKKTILFLFFLFFSFALLAQKKFPVYLGVSANHAIGEFTTTHSVGFGIEAGSAKNWFEFKKGKKISFAWKGGLAYYLGKKVTTSGFSNKYPGYSLVHAFAGLQFNPLKKTSFRLFAGPGLGIYSGNTRVNISTELDGTYMIKDKLAVGPCIILIKESGAEPIWAIGLKTIFKF